MLLARERSAIRSANEIEIRELREFALGVIITLPIPASMLRPDDEVAAVTKELEAVSLS